ncbi:MAG TPA: surface-adhesin E family protein [Burkholderiales bacterium]
MIHQCRSHEGFSLVEYDCGEKQLRGLVVSLPAEHMGEGKVIYADESPHEWEPLVADTMGEVLWKFACK